MKGTIDAAGRVVVPKAMRVRLGLVGATDVEIEERDGAVEIRLPIRDVRLVQGPDGRPLLRAPQASPPLTVQDVRALVEESRAWPRES